MRPVSPACKRRSITVSPWRRAQPARCWLVSPFVPQGILDRTTVQPEFGECPAIQFDDWNPFTVPRPQIISQIDVQHLDAGATPDKRHEFMKQLFAQVTAGPAVDMKDRHVAGGS